MEIQVYLRKGFRNFILWTKNILNGMSVALVATEATFGSEIVRNFLLRIFPFLTNVSTWMSDYSHILIPLVLFVTFIFNLLNNMIKTEAFDQAAEHFQAFHHDLMHAFFDMRKANTKENKHAFHKDFYSSLKITCDALCGNIYFFFKHRYNKDISVCIKMYEADSLKHASETHDIGNIKVFTLSRSGSDDITREKLEVAEKMLHYAFVNPRDAQFEGDLISEISDFYTMTQANQSMPNHTSAFRFASQDMVRYRNRIRRFNAFNMANSREDLQLPVYRPYRTTSGKWWDKYQFTVCVPIRINKKYLDDATRELVMGENLIVGFLCIDTKKPIQKRLRLELESYTEAFAYALSGFFHEISVMDMKIDYQPKDRTDDILEYLQHVQRFPKNDGIPQKCKLPDFLCICHMKLMIKAGKSAADILEYQHKKLAKFSNVAPDIMYEDDPFYKYLHSDLIPETFSEILKNNPPKK